MSAPSEATTARASGAGDLRFEQLVYTSAFVMRVALHSNPQCSCAIPARAAERRERMVGIIQCSREQHTELFDHSRHDSADSRRIVNPSKAIADDDGQRTGGCGRRHRDIGEHEPQGDGRRAASELWVSTDDVGRERAFGSQLSALGLDALACRSKTSSMARSTRMGNVRGEPLLHAGHSVRQVRVGVGTRTRDGRPTVRKLLPVGPREGLRLNSR